jgi:hypothetical protein
MNAYVAVKGETAGAILQAVLPRLLVKSAPIIVVGERSGLASVARTYLVTRYKPVAVLVDTYSRNEGMIHERVQSMEEVLKLVSGRIPIKVIPVVPEIEIVFFEAVGLLEKLFGPGLPSDVFLLARFSPKEALEQLFSRHSGPHDLASLLERLDEQDLAALRLTRPVSELIAFLSETADMPPQRSRL